MDPIRTFYERFPYPTAAVLEQAIPGPFPLWALSCRRPGRPLPASPRIWIAGCGTRQATQVALEFPEAEIVATDLSTASLEVAQRIAQSAGADHIAFSHLDIAAAPFDAAFDLIFCTGVLHHMPDPAAGARVLRRALRPGGLARLMLYNRHHRRPFATMQAAVKALVPEAGPDERLQVARELLAAILASDRCGPLSHELRGFDALPEEDFVDTLINPREQSYDTDQLRALVAAAGLTFVDWLYPALWDPELFFDHPTLLARCEQLKAPRRDALICHAAGFDAPYFDFLVERDDAPRCDALVPLSETMPLFRRATVRHHIEDAALVRTEEIPSTHIDDDTLVVTLRREGYRHHKQWALPVELLPVLEACDGQTPLRDIVSRHEDVFDADELYALWPELLPSGMNIIAHR